MKAKMKRSKIIAIPGPDTSAQDAPLSAFLSLFNASTEVVRRGKCRDTWFFDLLKSEEQESK